MAIINFPKCNRLVLLGGGVMPCRLAKKYGNELSVVCITSPRHADSYIEEEQLLFKDVLVKYKIKYLVTDSISSEEVRGFLGDNTESLCISFGAAWIFKEDVIESLFHSRLVNLHGARLPEDRGSGGFTWQILSKGHFGNCLLHLVDMGVDTGPVLSSKEYLYPVTCRIPLDYMRVYRDNNEKFVVEFIDKIIAASQAIDAIVQPEYLSSFWPRLATPINGWIDWSWSCSEIERFVCAFDKPYPGARTTLKEKTVILMDATYTLQDSCRHPFQSGLIYRVGPSWICISSNQGNLIVETVLDENGNNITGEIKVGDRFVTPFERLDKAMGRVFWGPRGVRN